VTPSSHTYSGFDYDVAGAIYIDGSYIDLDMTNVAFSQTSAVSKGGALYTGEIGVLNIDSCTFTDVAAEDDGAAIYIKDLDNEMSIVDSTIRCKSSPYV